MPSLITRGGMSAKALGFGASTSGPAVYVEDVFSTYLYTGNGTNQTIVNNISIGNYYAGVSGGAIQTATGSYCTVPNNSAFDFGSGNFTVEFFVYFDGSAQWDVVYKGTSSVYSPFGIILGSYNGAGYASLYTSNTGSSWSVALSSQYNLALNAWNHVAAVRNGNVFNIYVNGIGGLSPQTVSGALTVNTQALGLGGCNNGDFSQSGRISNLRIVKGTAVYTADFTPPSSALTAISGTQLLCFQGSTPFVDNSANAFTITQVGTPSALTTGPFPYTTGNGGLVWLKSRSENSNHEWFDTARGVNLGLQSNYDGGNANLGPSGGYSPYGAVGSFNVNGFSLNGPGYTSNFVNTSNATYASWTFRKQQKFFDIVTYTGTGSATTVAHNLGCSPGMIIVKRLDALQDWQVWQRDLGAGTNGQYNLRLNTTDAKVDSGNFPSAPTSTSFSIGIYAGTNASGATYVAYLFADSNSGGFGATGADSVVACGSYTGNGTANGPTVTLGWEPQYVIVKTASAATYGGWFTFDTMRGWTASNDGNDEYLYANSLASAQASNYLSINATGFSPQGSFVCNESGVTYIYLAIRRGPMKTPTDATKVFAPASMNSNPVTVNYGFPLDLFMSKHRSNGDSFWWADRLRGIATTSAINSALWLSPGNGGGTGAELTASGIYLLGQTSAYANGNASISGNNITFALRRAPGFFDIVCYTGTGSATTVTHNLGVAPELMIVKSRSSVGDASTNWAVYHSALGPNYIVFLNGTSAQYGGYSPWFNSTPSTATTFGANTSNASGTTYVAYLFATCAGVSKVGSYTGTGAAQNIDCGFSAAARFIMIKRTDSTGDWYVYNSVDGISSSTDPYVLMNGSGTQVTGTDYVNTYVTGFSLTSSAPAELNANGGSYIFLAIA